MKKAALYIRVSTAEQNTAMQHADLQAHAEQRGYEIYKVYEDTASGASQERKALDQLLKDARSRKFNIVLVWKFDRFARSLSMLIHHLELFKVLGIDFISYTEGIDTTTTTGKLIFSINAAYAEYERGIIAERVKAGIKTARAKRETWGKPELDQDSQDKIKAMRAASVSIRAIARELKIAPSTVSRYK